VNKKVTIKTIVTHELPHLDELFAFWLLFIFGGTKYLGIEKAKIVFWSSLPEGFKRKDHPDKLFVGIGGGPFDEHSTEGDKRQDGECAATLVANALNLSEYKPLTQLLEFVKNDDLNGSGTVFGLPQIISTMKLYASDEDVISWAFKFFDAEHKKQKDFFVAERDLKKAQISAFVGRKGKSLKIVSGYSDNTQFSRFARSKHGGNVAVVVQQNKYGTQIFFNKGQVLNPDEVARVLRILEQRKKSDGNLVTYRLSDLDGEGVVPGAEEWYYHRSKKNGGLALFNGSLTQDRPPTKLSRGTIIEAVKIALGQDYFPSELSDHCKEGICDASKKGCPYFKFSLGRCYKIRCEMKGKKLDPPLLVKA